MQVIRSLLLILMLLGLISTNILSITNAKFHDLLSGLLSQIPITDFMSKSKSKKFQSLTAENKRLQKQSKELTTENKRLQKQNKVFKQKNHIRKVKIVEARKISKIIVKRTAKNVALNMTSIAGEAVPYIGIALILSVTAHDIIDGCQTIKDTNRLLNLLDVDELKSKENQVCGMKVPTEQQVKETIGGVIYEMLN
ncbi:MAG: hypothetical protein GQ582_01455 [Methyloprofundus sp.]|nr:hypothetical protein [Methyloprofundus sp.]